MNDFNILPNTDNDAHSSQQNLMGHHASNEHTAVTFINKGKSSGNMPPSTEDDADITPIHMIPIENETILGNQNSNIFRTFIDKCRVLKERMKRPYEPFNDESIDSVVINHQNSEFDVAYIQYNIYLNCFASTFMFCLAIKQYMMALGLILVISLVIFLRIFFDGIISKWKNLFMHLFVFLNFVYITVIFTIYKDYFVIGTIDEFAWLTILTGIVLLIMSVYKSIVILGDYKDYLSLRNIIENENIALVCGSLYFLFSCVVFSTTLFDSMIVLNFHYSTLILIFILNSAFMILKLVRFGKLTKEFVAAAAVAVISILLTIVTNIYGFNHEVSLKTAIKNIH